MNNRQSFVYILTNYTNTTLYTGATGKPLKYRVWEHKEKLVEGFTKKYNINKLVYFEVSENLESAFEREKQIKGGSRKKKLDLINTLNPTWQDLYDSLD